MPKNNILRFNFKLNYQNLNFVSKNIKTNTFSESSDAKFKDIHNNQYSFVPIKTYISIISFLLILLLLITACVLRNLFCPKFKNKICIDIITTIKRKVLIKNHEVEFFNP